MSHLLTSQNLQELGKTQEIGERQSEEVQRKTRQQGLVRPQNLNGQNFDESNSNGLFDELLNKLYYSSENPSAFSSPRILYHSAKKIDNRITFKDVKNFLNKQDLYTSFKKPIYRIKRRVTEKGFVDSDWQIDTFFLLNLKKYNSGYQVYLSYGSTWVGWGVGRLLIFIFFSFSTSWSVSIHGLYFAIRDL